MVQTLETFPGIELLILPATVPKRRPFKFYKCNLKLQFYYHVFFYRGVIKVIQGKPFTKH